MTETMKRAETIREATAQLVERAHTRGFKFGFDEGYAAGYKDGIIAMVVAARKTNDEEQAKEDDPKPETEE